MNHKKAQPLLNAVQWFCYLEHVPALLISYIGYIGFNSQNDVWMLIAEKLKTTEAGTR